MCNGIMPLEVEYLFSYVYYIFSKGILYLSIVQNGKIYYSYRFNLPNSSSKRCVFRKKFLILCCRAVETTVKADIQKVFFAKFPLENVAVFKTEGQRIALIPCIAMWLCIICAYTHTIQVWGIASFIFVWVLLQPSNG